MRIEKAEITDLPKILKLQKICFQESALRHNSIDIPPLQQTLLGLEREYETTVILKVLLNVEIVGSIRAFVNKDTCYIGRVIVHPKFQNRGIGKQLMKEIENRFSDVKRYELFTGFLDEKNLSFYKSLGYTRYKEEKQTDSLTLVYMEKCKDVDSPFSHLTNVSSSLRLQKCIQKTT